jgi:small conductance mechanosensitive channel
MDGFLFWDWFLGTPLRIAGVVALSLVLRFIINRAINRITHRAVSVRASRRTYSSGDAASDSIRRDQRAQSVSQLLHSVVTVGITAIAAITILAMVGINVAPILASAGVVGVALGIGAQTLVKDYLAGIFMILEDQYGIGDLVDVGEAIGHVEEIGLRITRIRDADGVLWYVRNGEIIRVANQSRISSGSQ